MLFDTFVLLNHKNRKRWKMLSNYL